MSIEQRILRGRRRATILLLLAVAAGTIAAALFIAQAILISEIVNRVFLQDQTLNLVAPLLLIAFLLLFIRAALIWVEELLAQYSASDVKSDLRDRLIQHIFHLGPTYTRSESSGELVHTLVEGVESLDDYITQYLPAKVLAAVVPAIVFVVVLILDPWTTLVYIVAGPMLLLLLALIGGQTKAIQQRRFREMSWMSAFFLDMLQGLPTLKMFGRSREQAANIREISRHYGNTTMEVLRTAFQTALVLEWSATAATALVALEVSLRLMNGTLPFNIALAVLLLTPEFFLPLRRYALRYHSGARGKAAAERICAVLDKTPPPSAPAPDQESAPARLHPPPLAHIHFQDVSFAYQDGQRRALSHLTMDIPHGRSLALVGSTGAGKSTISNLLLRFINADSGAISVNGAPLKAIEKNQWRSQVAWVPQHPHLFYGSVAGNILLARPHATEDELLAAAQAANAHDFIQELPAGYDTQIGEQGVRLSGGQRQRIAIARAFLKDAPFLILDEATSHLDADSEKLVGDALLRLMQGRTVLIIAHRLALAYKADQIVVIENGRSVQSGTHNSMLAEDGPYRRLVNSYQGV